MILKRFLSVSIAFLILNVLLKHSVVLSPASSTPKKHLSIEVQADNIEPGVPLKIIIPSINLNTQIFSVSLNQENLVDVPLDDVGWYQSGPKPGDIGIASLDGHFVDTNFKPGIFYNLSKLKIGDDVFITDDQNHQFNFKIVETELVDLDNFPVNKVYGSSDKSLLSLVTCAGNYDKKSHNFSQRTIVYAQLVND